MNKTLIELLKDTCVCTNKILDLQKQVDSERAASAVICEEIQNRFSPKHLLGQELIIVDQYNSLGSKDREYQKASKDDFNSGKFPTYFYYTKNVGKAQIGKKAKVIQVLLHQVKNNEPDVLIWKIIAISQNMDGSYGKREVSTLMFDKVELVD